MKRPAFQFYPADWRKDMALQSCSVAARGLWVDMLCIAHECDPYGHLTVNGKPMTAAQIGRHTGLTERECAKLITELEDSGVLSRTEEGAIYSRRMVRDEDIRQRRAEGGKAGSEHGAKGAEHGSKGGRPSKETGDKKPPFQPPLEPPPSSSSSSSASAEIPSLLTQAPALPPEDRPQLALVGEPSAKPKGPPDCPHQAVLALWAEVLPAMPQHLPSQWRGTRADHLRARWRETAMEKGWRSEAEGLDYLRKLFAYVGKSAFLTGRTKTADGRRPFTVELEWLVNPTNWAKVHEGKYHTEAA
jgi:hypothetical protein